MQNFQWFKDFQSNFSGRLAWNERLAQHTYYQVGGPAQLLALPKSLKDLEWIAQGIQENTCPYFIMGLGSNVIASDAGYSGLLIKSTQLNQEVKVLSSSEHSIQLWTGGSVSLFSLVRKAAHEGWEGLEFLTGIPGSVGGAVRMNAGTHLGEVKNALIQVQAYCLEKKKFLTFEKDQLLFQYRKNLFLPSSAIVWSAVWKLKPGDPRTIKKLVHQTLQRRKMTQPTLLPSCGCIFKNPKGLKAWEIIDHLGLRGYRIGNAQYSQCHSNFIVNLGQAKASEICQLIQLAQKEAKERLGIDLEEEVIYIK